MNFIKKFNIVARFWSFTASSSSVIFGSICALVFTEIDFNIFYFVLAFVGMVSLHSGANILNDIYDYKKGIDREIYPASGGVVRGLVSMSEAYLWSIILFVIGISIGIFLAIATSKLILIIGALGIFMGIFYSFGLGFKYYAFGDLFVFFSFGILGSTGGWLVQTGEFSWLPVLWDIPASLLIIAILHSNNWRDIERDTNVGTNSIASIFGDKFSERYYLFLIFMPFLLVLIYIFVPRFVSFFMPPLPLTYLLVLLALPKAIGLIKKALRRKDPEKQNDFLALDGSTAGFHFIFVMLSVIGLLLWYFIGDALR
jgi:1,4-dihydroxy-2-naphthoate octaprenyltransferase